MLSKKEVLHMVAKDMKNDAQEFEGKPFNGKNVATYLGNLGAAVAVLATIIASIEEVKNGTK